MHDTRRIPVTKLHGTGNVLLVEDDELLARGLVRQIAAAGYAVTHVTSAPDAVERLMNGAFDIVLSDLNLPGASGVDVLEVARAYDKDVSLVLMTGGPTLETAIDAVGLGVLEYLVKPTATEDLVRVLRRASSARRSAVLDREVRASEAPDARSVSTSGACASLRATFDRAMTSLAVDLEPIVDSRTRRVLGYAARVASGEEALRTEAALVVAADRLGRLQDLRRRARDLAVRAFADMRERDERTLLFVDVHQSDLLDGDMYSADPPLARIADRVVLQVRGSRGGLAIEDLAARAHVLRFVGFRLAVTDLEDGACLSQIAELCPEFVKLDAKLVRGLDREGAESRRKRIVSALVSMCRALDATPIAEGVSSAEEREALAGAGCELVQGALVARHAPLSVRRAPREMSRADQA